MSTAAPNPPPPQPVAQPAALVRAPENAEIRIVSHSNLFYWWPVWAVGLLMALLTFLDDHRMALVPEKTVLLQHSDVKLESVDYKDRDLFVAPAGVHFQEPHLHMTTSKNYGVLWAMVLLMVIMITNVPLRGLWSVVVIVVMVLLSIIFALSGWWEHIFGALRLLAIHINAGGYLFISLVLLALWLVTFLFFDRTMYMIFTPGQLKVCNEVGGGEKAYDTSGMTVEKQRSDLFRHWILGLGSGDLIVNTSGAGMHHFDLPNVLFVGKKVQQIEDMLRERAVVRGS